MSTRAAVDCDRCKKKDIADYATISVEVAPDTWPGPDGPTTRRSYLSLHFCGQCIAHTLHELRSALPYPEQVQWNGSALWQLVHQLTPPSRKLWCDRFLKPLPTEAGEGPADPSQAITQG